MGIFHGASNLGFVLGPLLGGLVAGSWGIGGAFMCVGMIGMATSIPMGLKQLTCRHGLSFFHIKLVTTAAVLLLMAIFTLKLYAPLELNARISHRYADVAMGTIVRFNLLAHDKKMANRAADKAFAQLKKLQNDFDHRGSGSIGQINAMAGRQPVKVSLDAYDLIERAVRYASETGGVFDITIGAVSVEEGYDAEKIKSETPSLVGYQHIQLDPAKRTVFLPERGMALDLGGIAKGAIIDKVTQILEQEGIRAGIVEAGGDFYCFGDQKWNVGIQHPRRQELLDIVRVHNKGVCGSGDYHQFVLVEEDQGLRRHHIIDPEQMSPAFKSISVTVLAGTAEQADVLATTLFIMGPEQGKAFLAEKYPRAAALWITRDHSLSQTENLASFLLR